MCPTENKCNPKCCEGLAAHLESVQGEGGRGGGARLCRDSIFTFGGRNAGNKQNILHGSTLAIRCHERSRREDTQAKKTEPPPSPPTHTRVRQYILLNPRNLIGDTGAEILTRPLHTNASVEVLSLGGNRLTDRAARSLARLMQSGRCSLRSLNLTGVAPKVDR